MLLFYFTFHYRNLLPHVRCRTWNSPHGRSVHYPTWLCLLGSWLPREKRGRNMKAARLQPLYIAGRCSRACYEQHTITSFFIFLYRFLPRLKTTQNHSCCTSDPLSWFCSCVFSVPVEFSGSEWAEITFMNTRMQVDNLQSTCSDLRRPPLPHQAPNHLPCNIYFFLINITIYNRLPQWWPGLYWCVYCCGYRR